MTLNKMPFQDENCFFLNLTSSFTALLHLEPAALRLLAPDQQKQKLRLLG